MNFIDVITKYYLREAQQGFGAALFGGILLIAAILLFRFANPLSFLKGLTIPLLLVGLVMGLGGSIDGYMARRNGAEKVTLFKKNRKAFFNQEVVKVEKAHRSWRGIIIGWGVLTVTGVALLLGVQKSYWTGVAIGTIVLSMAGQAEEAISKRFNERYYYQVLAEAKSNASSTVSLPPNVVSTGELSENKAVKYNHHKASQFSIPNTSLQAMSDSLMNGSVKMTSQKIVFVQDDVEKSDTLLNQRAKVTRDHEYVDIPRHKFCLLKLFSKNR